MARVLVLFAHPALEKSRVHQRLVARVPDHPDVTFHDLYERYPRLDIDVRGEQALLDAHDTVVLQFPFYWYSTPPMLKQWQDLVLEHGWAYGSTGTALRGKTMLCALSAGGPREAYQEGGYNRLTVRALLAPLERTAILCGMHYLPPWIVYGTHGLSLDVMEERGREYGALLEALVGGELPVADGRGLDDLNDVVRAHVGGGVA